MAFSEVYTRPGEKGVIYFTEDQKTSFEEYSQNLGKGYWEQLMDSNFPLTLVDWELTSIQGTEDKYDK